MFLKNLLPVTQGGKHAGSLSPYFSKTMLVTPCHGPPSLLFPQMRSPTNRSDNTLLHK